MAKQYLDQFPGLAEHFAKAEVRRKAREALEDAARERKKRVSCSTFVKSAVWKQMRETIFERDGRICRKCGSKEKLQIDHILPRSKRPDLELDPNNLRVLCWPCNKAKGVSIEEGV